MRKKTIVKEASNEYTVTLYLSTGILLLAIDHPSGYL